MPRLVSLFDWHASHSVIIIEQLMNEAEYLMEVEEGVIRRGRRHRWITPSEISIILHMIRKPNSITVLLFIQNNS